MAVLAAVAAVAVLAAAAAVPGGALAATPDQTIRSADPDAAGQGQGRDHRPSEHVLEALARALRLDYV